ncbi:hypothetical protein [Streptomyces sp. B93]|uniref:hypothetical protein n=1 Tax=Streptomyces sp. B93 TaxID=2824875 RepID=UPI001B37EACA|nr:hypothetical protein [Streptomyces sp. B93]MBQ1090691.1 hypothetical protein [Streptomyces sp. B93]
MERRGGMGLWAGLAATALLLAGCGGGGGDDDAGAPAGSPPASERERTSAPPETTPSSDSPTSDPSPTGAAPASDIDLDEVILKPGDLAEFQITESPGGDRDIPPTKASPATCQPVENLRLDAYTATPSATARRFALATTGDYRGTGTTITLTAFTATDAEKTMSDLRSAVTKCANGYEGGALTFNEVRKLTPVPVGDEAISFHLSGRATPTSYTLVRQGSILVRLSSAVGTGGEAEVPQPVVVQQVMKIQAAAARTAS